MKMLLTPKLLIVAGQQWYCALESMGDLEA